MTFRSILYLTTVFLTGAAVLVIEIAAMRLLSIQFGTSLDVISGVLTVILLSLSCGYFFGGRLADRRPHASVLYAIVTVSGLSLLILASLAYVVLHPTIALTTAAGPLVLALAFFFLPAFLLGMDSPFVIKLLTERTESERHGSIVGQVFFWSTAGSICGSLLAGFVLLPSLGVKESLIATSIVLLGLGCGGYLVTTESSLRLGKLKLTVLSFLLMIAIGTVMATEITAEQLREQRGVLYEGDGLYSHLLVYEGERDGRPIRVLKREVNHSAAIYPGSTDIVFEYLHPLPDQLALQGDVERMLVIGGGAYTLPKAVHERSPDTIVHVAEIEPKLYELAERYFELPETDTIINHVADGRRLLAATSTHFDLIYVDAYNSGHYMPPNLVTREFMQLLHDRLTEDGLLVINFIGTPTAREHETLTGSFMKTFTAVFSNTNAYYEHRDRPTIVQNMLLQARPQPALPTTLPPTAVDDFGQVDPTSLIHETDTIFTDNRSRAELLLTRRPE